MTPFSVPGLIGFRRNDFQKMPLRRSFSQLGKFSTKISLLAELEHAEFTAETQRRDPKEIKRVLLAI